MYVDLDLLKKHVRADDFADDDDYLSHLLDVAEDCVVRATNRTADELVEMGGGVFPAALKQAVLLEAGHLYNCREAVSTGSAVPVPYALEALVKPFTRLVADDDTADDDTADDDTADDDTADDDTADVGEEVEGV